MNQVFERETKLPVTAAEAFAWHDRPGALDRLIPPWEKVSIAKRSDSVRDGNEVELVQRLGPLRMTWVARHYGYQEGCSFRDMQAAGPFSEWEHLHDFRADADGLGTLRDHIEYRIPGGVLGRLLAGPFVRTKLARMFAYRHNVTHDDLAAHDKHKERGTMNVAISGAGGLVGSTLAPLLTTGGHRVIRLVRRDARAGEVQWDPEGDRFDAAPLDGTDAVVHLAGENIAAGRWTRKLKDRIRDSRVQGTRILCEGLARMAKPPRVLACASAIGFYGDRGEEVLTEDSPAGQGFLADVAEQWEAATQPARDAGIRVVNLRFGVILSPRGGALAKMLLPFKLGAGGRVGSGRQFWSWVSIDDVAGAIHHVIMTEDCSGPINVVSPQPVTNLEFTKTLGKVLHRPTVAPMPAFAAKLALGEMAEELLLASQRVEPQRLKQCGYTFRHPTLEGALRHVLGKAE